MHLHLDAFAICICVHGLLAVDSLYVSDIYGV